MTYKKDDKPRWFLHVHVQGRRKKCYWASIISVTKQFNGLDLSENVLTAEAFTYEEMETAKFGLLLIFPGAEIIPIACDSTMHLTEDMRKLLKI